MTIATLAQFASGEYTPEVFAAYSQYVGAVCFSGLSCDRSGCFPVGSDGTYLQSSVARGLVAAASCGQRTILDWVERYGGKRGESVGDSSVGPDGDLDERPGERVGERTKRSVECVDASGCCGQESGNDSCSVASHDGLGSDRRSEINVRGKHWARNRAKREKRKKIAGNWRAGIVHDQVLGGSVAGTVNTVDTRCAEEIEAARTLAIRRVAENKVAAAKAECQLRSYQDKAKSEAVARLDAARMEQRINEAKAKSQASYKKCDESMKSLGSSGSAGEFALKQEVKKARDSAVLMKFVQQQADLMMKYASPEVRDMVNAIPVPVLENEFDVFGDCPADFTEDQRESYYLDLQLRQEENDLVTASWS